MGNLTVINVTDPPYNADNTGAHDTSDQINLALQAVPVGVPPNIAQGATVYLPRGTYKINKPLIRKVSFTRCVGEGKDATVILLDAANWQGTISLADPVGSFMFDLQSYSVTDCGIADMRINGAAGSLPSSAAQSTLYSGILCSERSLIERVSIYDVWGFGLWIFGGSGAWTTLVDCDADKGLNTNAPGGPSGGNDTIGGGGLRTKIVRFYWMPTLAKNSALDFTAPGATMSEGVQEVSVDIIDCINESPKVVALEGCIQSTVRGSRFYGNNLAVRSDAFYDSHSTVQNSMDVLVADNLFVGLQPQPGAQYVGGTCYVALDGGTLYCPGKGLLNHGGRIAILGNTFINSAGANPAGGEPGSAIRWQGDDASNSDGGSIIHGNRILNPNPNGITTDYEVKGGCGKTLGWELGCGIAVFSSYGLTIGRNTIEDTRTPQLMQYAMQLFSSRGLLSGAATGRIIVEDNLCGSAPGVGYGKQGAFYVNPSPNSDAVPLPILHRNTNQDAGYDSAATTQISGGAATGTPWPLLGGYPYDAIITVSGGTGVEIDLGVTDTRLQSGAFYLPAGQHINIKWTTTPTIKVFRV